VSGFPEIATLVPHAGPMCLLSRVLEHDRERTVCAVSVDRSALFREPDGSVPAWLGLEYMAQCMAAHAGLEAAAGRPPPPALLLGSRRLRLAVDEFAAGTTLAVSARHHRGEAGLVAFDCEIRDAAGGPALVEGRINVYTLDADQLEGVER
jgi:predicted hotdog family 3-hydroxylacyl-ACP dehydratase